MALHIVNKLNVLTTCQRMLQPTDALLLIEDAVYVLLQDILPNIAPSPLYLLQEDVAARGLSAGGRSAINLVNYDEFVALVVQHPSIHNWY